MPRPGLPPTPASSTDITGKCNAGVPQIEPIFSLPPAAIATSNHNSNVSSRGSMDSSTASSNHSSDSSYRPISPHSPIATPRKRSSTALQSKSNAEDFSLPPPPTRSRKIIQMKPRAQGQPAKPTQQILPATDQTESASAASASNKNAVAQSAGGKKKQGAGTSAAGRKIARKTAHSLIERRRRSKMNEEFGVLKDMIPACAGQEMHKLAILQASIEYLRYLERCVSDLQAAGRSPYRGNQHSPMYTLPMDRTAAIEDEDEDDEDEGMTDNGGSGTTTPFAQIENQVPPTMAPSPVHKPAHEQTKPTASTPRPILPSISPMLSGVPSTHTSPAIHPSDHQQSHQGSRHYSLSSYATSASSSYLHSSLPSPAFESLSSHRLPGSSGSLAEFRLASPALKPQFDALQEKHGSTSASSSPPNANAEVPNYRNSSHRPASGSNLPDAVADARAQSRVVAHGPSDGDIDMDQQATAALLMLNADRRSWDNEESRGMSVRDLLRD